MTKSLMDNSLSSTTKRVKVGGTGFKPTNLAPINVDDTELADILPFGSTVSKSRSLLHNKPPRQIKRKGDLLLTQDDDPVSQSSK